MSSSAAFLVSGATGSQGGSVARELLKAGHRVHVLVRDASKPQAKELASLGAVVFVGDYSDADAIRKATAGVKGVFINPYPDMADPKGEGKQTQLFVDAARAAGTVDTLVISTVFKADRQTQWAATTRPDHPLHNYSPSKVAAEEAVRASGVKYWTVLRPSWLFQNLVLPASNMYFPDLPTEHAVRIAIDVDLPIAQLDAQDVGRWAAAAFADPARFTGKTLELGVYNLTLRESLRQLSEATGVDIPITSVPVEELEKDTANPLSAVRAAFAQFLSERGEDFKLTEGELEELKTYNIPFTTWPEYLEKDRARVLETLNLKA